MVKDLIDSGLKTLPRNNRNQRKNSKDMICTENIFEGIGNVQQISNKVRNEQQRDETEEVEPEEKSRAKKIAQNIENGSFRMQNR